MDGRVERRDGGPSHLTPALPDICPLRRVRVWSYTELLFRVTVGLLGLRLGILELGFTLAVRVRGQRSCLALGLGYYGQRVVVYGQSWG